MFVSFIFTTKQLIYIIEEMRKSTFANLLDWDGQIMESEIAQA